MDMDTACSSDGSMAPSSSSHASHVGSTSGEETVTGTGSDTSTTCTPTLKKPRYACRFHPNSNQFTWAKVSRKGPSFAYCTTCSRNISVAYGGNKDLSKHERTDVHQAGSRSVAGVSSITSYFQKPGPKRVESVVEAEVKFGYFLAEHHLAFSVADHCSKLFPSLFPDSAIAKAFKCGRTKATAIVKVLAEEVMKEVICRLEQSQFFSLHTDETTDITVFQQCALMLRFFDDVEGKVRCTFLKLQPVRKADAGSLFQALDSNFSDNGAVQYANLVGLGSDGANVMLGARNSVLTRLKAKQPALVSFHCNCHLAALIANHACRAMPDYLEDVTIQLWYFFQKSPKRYRTFEEFQVFVDAKPHKLLKAGQTRWLSLEMCVNRLLEQLDALVSYFRSTDERSSSIQRISTSLEKPLTKVYLMFLSSALQVINAFNKLMQIQAPTVHFLHREVQSFVKKLLLRFMLPSVVQETQVSLIDLDDTSQYLPVEEVFVGDRARRYLDGEYDLQTNEVRIFCETCKQFWLTAAKYAVKKLPIDSDFLNSLSWLHPRTRDYSMLNQVVGISRCLPQVIKDEERAQLEEEFMDYCISDHNQEFDVTVTTAIDTYWHKIGQVTDSTGQLRHPLLARLAKAILIIPHGNADVERSFSQMGLNKPKLRNSLGVDTLNALLQIQCNVEDPCYNFKPTPEVLARCKNAISAISSTN